MEIAWQVEIDPFCSKVLAKRWPNVKRYGDIRELTGEELEPVDLICGGFPCQPVSVAGKRKGRSDERWLWPEFARLLRVVRPRYALIENVPGLLRLGMGEVLRELAASGYDAEWQTIPAAAFGAPHLRYRVFIVAHTCGRRREYQPLFGRTDHHKEQYSQEGEQEQDYKQSGIEKSSSPLADSNKPRQSVFQGCSEHHGLEGKRAVSKTDWWDVEPSMGRLADGVPQRVDQLRALGNAVVPQIVEWIGHQIMATEAAPVLR